MRKKKQRTIDGKDRKKKKKKKKKKKQKRGVPAATGSIPIKTLSKPLYLITKTTPPPRAVTIITQFVKSNKLLTRKKRWTKAKSDTVTAAMPMAIATLSASIARSWSGWMSVVTGLLCYLRVTSNDTASSVQSDGSKEDR